MQDLTYIHLQNLHHTHNSEHNHYPAPKVSSFTFVILPSYLSMPVIPRQSLIGYFFVTVDWFAFSRILWMWHHAVCTLFWREGQASFRIWLWACLCCCIYQQFAPYQSSVVFHCMNTPECVYSFTLDCSQSRAFINKVGINICVQVFMWGYVFISLG